MTNQDALVIPLPYGEARVYLTAEPTLRGRLVGYFEKIARTGKTPKCGPTGRARRRYSYPLDRRTMESRERAAYERETGRKPRSIAEYLRDDLGITDRERLQEAMRQWSV